MFAFIIASIQVLSFYSDPNKLLNLSFLRNKKSTFSEIYRGNTGDYGLAIPHIMSALVCVIVSEWDQS